MRISTCPALSGRTRGADVRIVPHQPGARQLKLYWTCSTSGLEPASAYACIRYLRRPGAGAREPTGAASSCHWGDG
eukprot:2752070-Pyramimonas_sp.AAC.1